MIESLSEFCASKSRTNRLSRYSEIKNEEERHLGLEDEKDESWAQSRARVQRGPPNGLWKLAEEARIRQEFEVGRKREFDRSGWRPIERSLVEKFAENSHQNGSLAFCDKINCRQTGSSGKWSPEVRGKSSIASLLSALLFSSRRKRFCPKDGPPTRTQLLATLLKLPAVLGAMFSLSLVVTLLVLYGLNFRHCELAQHLASASNLGEGTSSEISNNSVSHSYADSDNQILWNRTNRRHHINSRQLASLERPASIEKPEDQPQEPIPSNRPMDSDKSELVYVRSECASHLGQQEEPNSFTFRAIPYASPPVGSRRWQRPRPVWQDENLCNSTGSGPLEGHKVEKIIFEKREGPEALGFASSASHCLQLSPFSEQRQLTGSEDCLYLDIFLPSKALQIVDNGPISKIKLPVMVYIHGGFLAFGSSQGKNRRPDSTRVNWLEAQPSGKLASELNVVLVAPNFRLQALGFMALDQLGSSSSSSKSASAASNSSGNYGLWDQLVALQWIQRNIEKFGGDRDNVILFGPDSASALPLALMSNRKNQGLFHAVWLTNPTVFFNLPPKLANQHYERLIRSQSVCSLDHGGSTSRPPNDTSRLAECLMGLPGEQVVKEYLGQDDATYRLDDQNSLPIRNIFPDQFVELDGQLVEWSFPFVPNQGLKTIQSTKVDDQLRLLIGSSAEAVEYWPCPRNLHAWNWDDFRRYVGASLNSFSSETYSRACKVYSVPTITVKKDKQSLSKRSNRENESRAVEVYLKMVSDIKQICPVNELVSTLRRSRYDDRKIIRYIVEQRPSESLAKELSSSKKTNDFGGETSTTLRPDNKLRHSFHYFDLMAFFGFENDVRNSTSIGKTDLEFQRNIRHVIKDFAWKNDLPTEGYTLFKSGRTEHIFTRIEYRQRECNQWNQLLGGQSYAWIS